MVAPELSYHLYDRNDGKVKFVDALANYARNEKVTLIIEGKRIELSRYKQLSAEASMTKTL